MAHPDFWFDHWCVFGPGIGNVTVAQGSFNEIHLSRIATATGQVLDFREIAKAVSDWKGNAVIAFAFSPDRKAIVVTQDELPSSTWRESRIGLRRYDAWHELEGYGQGAETCMFSPDGAKIALSSRAYNLSMFDAASGGLLFSLNGYWMSVDAFPPIPSLSWPRVLRNGVVILDASTGEMVMTFDEGEDRAVSSQFSPDESCVLSLSLRPEPEGRACTDDGKPGTPLIGRIWDAGTGAMRFEMSNDDGELQYKRLSRLRLFSPKGTYFALPGKNVMRVWDTSWGKWSGNIR